MKKDIFTINLFDITEAKIISSRSIPADLKDKIKKEELNEIHIDFSDIEFVSRSAAHEFFLLKEELKPHKNVEFINTNDDVSEMFKAVAASRALPRKLNGKIQVERVSAEEFFKARI